VIGTLEEHTVFLLIPALLQSTHAESIFYAAW